MTSDAEPRADAQHAQTGALRVDQPHPGQPGDPHTVAERREVRLAAGAGGAEVAPADEAPTVAHSLEQLREHAAQLSDRLSEQQSELDRRESQLTAQEADLDARLQNARGWLEEREQELDRRAEELARKEQEAVEREEAAQARVTQLTEVREQALADREARLAELQSEIQRSEAALGARRESLDRDRAECQEHVVAESGEMHHVFELQVLDERPQLGFEVALSEHEEPQVREGFSDLGQRAEEEGVAFGGHQPGRNAADQVLVAESEGLAGLAAERVVRLILGRVDTVVTWCTYGVRRTCVAGPAGGAPCRKRQSGSRSKPG